MHQKTEQYGAGLVAKVSRHNEEHWRSMWVADLKHTEHTGQ